MSVQKKSLDTRNSISESMTMLAVAMRNVSKRMLVVDFAKAAMKEHADELEGAANLLDQWSTDVMNESSGS